MKRICFLFVILVLSITIANSQNKQGSTLQCHQIDIDNLNDSNIDLGPYYPGTNESISNEELVFVVEGDGYRCIEWDISKSGDKEFKLKQKFYGSSNGSSWKEIDKNGDAKLNCSGKYYIKIKLNSIEINTGIELGNLKKIYTVNVEYKY